VCSHVSCESTIILGRELEDEWLATEITNAREVLDSVKIVSLPVPSNFGKSTAWEYATNQPPRTGHFVSYCLM
jgi:hypothetical protein